MIKEVNLPQDHSTEEAPDFERAMEINGFGLFNIFLLFASLPGLWSTVFETTTMSYVLPAAECDLNLTLIDKSILNGITFGGMLISALLWGFIADAFGRKYTLIVTLFMEGTVCLLSVLSQNSKQLMAFKFFGGFMSSGPVAVFISYISEFHGKSHRVYIVIALGFINALPLTVLPAMATLILPSHIDFSIGAVKINSWKLFVAITAIPSLLSGFLLMLFPESPKFLMSKGKNDKAIKAFSTMYALNKFKKRITYPISTLKNEAPEMALKHATMKHHSSLKHNLKELASIIKEGLQHLRLVCHKTYLKTTIMVGTMFFFTLLSVNAIRLWRPQEFATLREMERIGFNEFNTCEIMKYSLNKTLSNNNDKKADEVCEVHIQPASYIDCVIVSATICANYILTVFLVNLIQNNTLLRIHLGVSCLSLIIDYWSISRRMILTLSSIYTACGVVGISLLLNASVNLYPTTLRTMAIIVLMICGRFGSIIGNLILPHLMSVHCACLFAFFSACILCTIIISFFLPNTTRDALK